MVIQTEVQDQGLKNEIALHLKYFFINSKMKMRYIQNINTNNKIHKIERLKACIALILLMILWFDMSWSYENEIR